MFFPPYISQAMNGQYLCNRQITVSYAYKKDTKGERHGTPAGGPLSCNYLFFCVFDKFKLFVSVLSWLSAHISSMMQKEFWLQVIQVHRRAGLILYLLVDLQRFPMLLRIMVPLLLRCLPAPSLMVLLQLLFLPSIHRLLKPQPSSLCQ